MGIKETAAKLKERLEIDLDLIEKGLEYLKTYGYIKEGEELDFAEILKGVKEFQKTAGLTVDGEMGPKTLRAMDWPRCGVPDGLLRAEEAKWGLRDLKYFVEKRDSDMPPDVWDGLIDKAFQQWAAVANLKFTKTTVKSQANFILSVGSGSADQFDGPSGTLAWAQLPPNNNYQGQLLSKMDSAETWRASLDAGNGILALNVFCHEFGHFLGLEHSQVNSALMAPFYSPNIPKPVQNDDVKRIQALYGPPTTTPPDPGVPPTPTLLAAPTGLTAEVSGEASVILRWKDNSTGEDRFEIWRNGENQGSVAKGNTSARDQQVPDGLHKYKIRAGLGEVVSEWSNEVQIAVGTVTPPIPPTPEQITIVVTGNITDVQISGYEITKK